MTRPVLPTLRALTARLRELHDAWAYDDTEGEYVGLVIVNNSYYAAHVYDGVLTPIGREYIPAGGLPFDAVAAAGRLLAAARDHEASLTFRCSCRRKDHSNCV